LCIVNTPSPDNQDGGIRIPISGQLFRAAVSECMADEGLWIDQVYIDQSNQAEKNISIPAMAALYKNARRVLVVMEDIEVDDAEQKFLENFIPEFENSVGGTIFSRPHFGEVPAYMEKYRIFREFFNKICSSRWFTRAWCSHEMRLGQSHKFYLQCSSDSGQNANRVLAFSGEFLAYMCHLASETPTMYERIREV